MRIPFVKKTPAAEKTGAAERTGTAEMTAESAPENRKKSSKRAAAKTSGKSVFSKENFRELFSILTGTAAEKEYHEVPVPVGDVPPYRGSKTEIESYWLTPPFAYARILQETDGKLLYELHEPKVTQEEFVLLEETVHILRETISYKDNTAAPQRISHKQVINILSSFDVDIPRPRQEVICYYLNRNLLGYGKIDGLMHDERIEDITCNGKDIPVYLYHHTYGNIKTSIIFGHSELNSFIIRLAQMADKQVSLTTPLVDAALPTGARAQITYSDVISSHGSSFTIRKFRSEPITPVDLIQTQTYTPELLACIWIAIENRQSVVVAGGTASGKTSTMNAVSFFIPQESKIVSIEDTREIQLPHENWLAMHTRETIASFSVGNIDMFALLKAALRQRPEYIIVGEVRGEEAQTLFQAMNTGHTTFSTLHAGNVSEAVSRLTHAPINVPPAMFAALRLMIIQGLHYQEGKGVRRCLSLSELYVSGDEVRWTPLFEWNPVTDSVCGSVENSNVFASICTQNNWTKEELYRQIQHRAEELTRLAKGPHLSAEEIGRRLFEISGV